MRRPALAISVGLLSGCAYLPSPYATLPDEECAVFVDLIDALDDPARPKGQQDGDYAPSAFPASPRLDTPIGGPGGKADVTTCKELMRRVHAHDVGAVAYLRDPDPQGPSVLFSRVTFDADHKTAAFDYVPAWGPLGMEVWALTMTRGADGHWKLQSWKLEMVS